MKQTIVILLLADSSFFVIGVQMKSSDGTEATDEAFLTRKCIKIAAVIVCQLHCLTQIKSILVAHYNKL